MRSTVYINGKPHDYYRAAKGKMLFYPQPGRHGEHGIAHLDDAQWDWLKNKHGGLYVGGVYISMLPPRPRRPSLAAKILNVIKEHYK